MDFVLTSDLDWASEDCVADFLQIAGRFSIKPTMFVTHDSAVVRRAAASGLADLGIHPNFLPGSDHGKDPASVLDFVQRLAPKAIAMRAHRYIGSPEISSLIAARGLTIDSNLCRHLAPGIAPEIMPGGVVRLPVFFEDDIHWMEGGDWSFETYRDGFLAPGLKILNFHPFFVALNAPDAAFYQRHKQLIKSLTGEQAARLRHQGAGARCFLIEAITAVLDSGHRFVGLGALAAGLTRQTATQTVRRAPDLLPLTM
ncbi:MAG TPA: hypothetical protein VGJ31_16485 [Dongiaceae bacterium]